MIEMTLPDMTCGHCVRTVTSTVHALDADATVTIDLASHKLQIQSARDAEMFKAALASEGYPAA